MANQKPEDRQAEVIWFGKFGFVHCHLFVLLHTCNLGHYSKLANTFPNEYCSFVHPFLVHGFSAMESRSYLLALKAKTQHPFSAQVKIHAHCGVSECLFNSSLYKTLKRLLVGQPVPSAQTPWCESWPDGQWTPESEIKKKHINKSLRSIHLYRSIFGILYLVGRLGEDGLLPQIRGQVAVSLWDGIKGSLGW